MSQVPFDVPTRRLLIVKVNGMGDSVMIRSIAEHLRQRRPDLEIGVVVGPATREVMTLNADFKTHVFKGFRAIRDLVWMYFDIRRQHYDAMLNFEQNFLKLNLLLRATGIRRRVGFGPRDGRPSSRVLTHQMSFDPNKSMWQCFIALARLIEPGIPEDLTTVPIEPGPTARMSASQWWDDNLAAKHPVIAMHLGSYYMDFKRWPLERFLELAEKIKFRAPRSAIVLTGTPPEQPLIHQFMKRFSGYAVDASSLGSL